MNPLFLLTVIESDIETSRHCYNQLVQPLVGMSSALRATWNIV